MRHLIDRPLMSIMARLKAVSIPGQADGIYDLGLDNVIHPKDRAVGAAWLAGKQEAHIFLICSPLRFEISEKLEENRNGD